MSLLEKIKTNWKYILIVVILAIITTGGILYYCLKFPAGETERSSLANSAAVYCEEQGGETMIKATLEGSLGYCVLPDGSVCQQWPFFNSQGDECVQPQSWCDLKDFCNTDQDCKYIWFTGGCYHPKYAVECRKELEEKGLFLTEAPPREGVFCTCESNKCITHN